MLKRNRVIFKFLPCICSNDLVAGSWYFVWGSFLSTIIPLVPILDFHYHYFTIPEKTQLDAFDLLSSWVMLSCSGIFFTWGSYALVRTFETPPIQPLVSIRIISNDAILAAWLYFLGSLPYPIYALVFVYYYPQDYQYYGALFFATLLFVASLMFVHASYSTEEDSIEYISPIIVAILGSKSIAYKRFFNSDWQISCWFCLFASLIWCVTSILMLLYKIPTNNSRQIFVYSSNILNSLVFVVGCAYYCTVSNEDIIKSISSRNNSKSCITADENFKLFLHENILIQQ